LEWPGEARRTAAPVDAELGTGKGGYMESCISKFLIGLAVFFERKQATLSE